MDMVVRLQKINHFSSCMRLPVINFVLGIGHVIAESYLRYETINVSRHTNLGMAYWPLVVLIYTNVSIHITN